MAKNIDEVKLPRSGVENYSCGRGASCHGVDVVKARDCIWVKDVTLTGDAPKGFVRLYEFQRDGKVRRNNPATWPLYIAKTGHKWYPVESITEHLLNRLGVVFGLRMADSKLALINGQLRFLSRYFLNPNRETLVHGAEIFAGYLEDQALVESIEKANLSRDLFQARMGIGGQPEPLRLGKRDFHQRVLHHSRRDARPVPSGDALCYAGHGEPGVQPSFLTRADDDD